MRYWNLESDEASKELSTPMEEKTVGLILKH